MPSSQDDKYMSMTMTTEGTVFQNSGALPQPGVAPKPGPWWKKEPNAIPGGPRPDDDGDGKSLLDEIIDFATGAESKR